MSDFKVSLANNYIDLQERCALNFPYIVQPKLDGVRCYIVKEDGEVKMYTRNGNEIVSCRHIAEQLGHVFDSIPGIILDGELYNHELNHDFSAIVSIVRKKNIDEATEEQARRLIRFCCFDCFMPDFEVDDPLEGKYTVKASEWKYSQRNKRLSDVLSSTGKYPEYIYMVDSTGLADGSYSYMLATVDEEIEVDELLSVMINEGFEGIMLKDDGPYRNGRSNSLLKYKSFKDSEYTLVDILEGTGSWEGQAASVVCRDEDGKTFKAGVTEGLFMGGDSVSLLRNREDYIGKKVTVKYQELTKSGVPRFGKAISVRDYE